MELALKVSTFFLSKTASTGSIYIHVTSVRSSHYTVVLTIRLYEYLVTYLERAEFSFICFHRQFDSWEFTGIFT